MAKVNYLSVLANNLSKLQQHGAPFFDKSAKYNQFKIIPVENIEFKPEVVKKGELRFPFFNTLIETIQLPDIKVVNEEAIVQNYTPYQQAIKTIEQIDVSRLKSTRSNRNRASKYSIYKISELKDFAKMLGLPSSGNKDALVASILERISS